MCIVQASSAINTLHAGILSVPPVLGIVSTDSVDVCKPHSLRSMPSDHHQAFCIIHSCINHDNQ